MLHLTVKDILGGGWEKLDPTFEPYCIYVVRDGETSLYVGKSNDPFNRLRAHFGVSWRSSGSSIGIFYKEHKDKADDWLIDLYTLRDCEEVVMRTFTYPVETYRDPRFHDDMVQRAEIAMIRYHRPCLNETYNDNASALPEKYEGASSIPCFGLGLEQPIDHL